MKRIAPASGTVLALLLLAAAPETPALEYELGGGNLTIKNRVSTGAAWRLQERSNALVGKLNVPGQQDLCATDNCYSITGDPAPNARLVAAPGSIFAVNADDGNNNYDRYDLVAATSKFATDLTFEKGEFLARVRGIAYYDPVNAELNERHFDTRFQDQRVRRPSGIADNFAKGVKLYDAFVQYTTEIADRAAVISVGQQTIRWGESNLLALNSVSEINPPNQNFLRFPGGEINEIFQPVPVALLSMDLFDNVSGELLYQFGWKRIEPDAAGSFFSDNDIAGDGPYAVIGLGQFGEDPDRQFRLAGGLGLLSSTSVTVYPEEYRPASQGQFGARINYNAEWLNGGTELSFYGLNYHSRLPYASVVSSDNSCARDSASGAEALIDCQGFRGTLGPILPGDGLEPLPIESLRVLLEYPENVQMFGISFNTTIGKLSVSGEYSYRPNSPVQVHLPDLVYAGLQPAFPANDIVLLPAGTGNVLGGISDLLGIGPGEIPVPLLAGLSELGIGKLPSAQHAIPSFLASYRGLGRIEPNTYIRGYERLGVGQFDITAIRIWSQNPFAADQVILLAEAGFQHVVGMPKLSEVQFAGGTFQDSHFGAGGDGTGLTAANSCNDAITGQTSDFTCKLNPTQQTRGFGEDFAWGLRSLIRMEYNDVIFGWSLKPTFALAWDVEGTAPAPQSNFVQGRKEFLGGTEVNITPSLTGRVLYQSFFGGKRRENTRADRDNISMSITYAF